jgi:hypothetical protein
MAALQAEQRREINGILECGLLSKNAHRTLIGDRSVFDIALLFSGSSTLSGGRPFFPASNTSASTRHIAIAGIAINL